MSLYSVSSTCACVCVCVCVRTCVHTQVVHVYALVCMNCAEPEIAVSHWPFSDQFQDLAEQK